MDDTYYLLIYCTCLCFTSEFLNGILKPLISLISQFGNPDFNEARTKINITKREMDQLSVTDDFAKFIKLQRKLNRLQEELKIKVTGQLNYSIKIRYGITYGLYLMINVLYLIICWLNWKSTVITLPENWMYPFSSCLAWPTAVPGGISVPAWLLISNVTAKLLSKSFKQSP